MGEVPSEAAGDILEADSCCGCCCGSAGVRKRPTSILSSSLAAAEDGSSAAGVRRWDSCKESIGMTKCSLLKCLKSNNLIFPNNTQSPKMSGIFDVWSVNVGLNKRSNLG